MIRSRVAAETLACFPLTTLDTVMRLTPASAAMSFSVTPKGAPLHQASGYRTPAVDKSDTRRLRYRPRYSAKPSMCWASTAY
nr:hypothetical protein GCM10025732_38560 [Glycomyces mayteni]